MQPLNLYLVSGPRSQDAGVKRNGVKVPGEHRRKENGVNSPRLDLTLAELQEMASRQQQQIEAQQQMLATKVVSPRLPLLMSPLKLFSHPACKAVASHRHLHPRLPAARLSPAVFRNPCIIFVQDFLDP